MLTISKLQLLGIPIDAVDFSQALDIITMFIEAKNTALVFTPNAEILVKAHDDKEFAQILREADLVVPDGSSLIWAAKVLGKPLKTRVTGIDLMQLLLAEANKKEWSVFFLGAKPNVIKLAAKNVKEKYPNLKLQGFHHGYFKDDLEPLNLINSAKPDLLFVGMGAPLQEKWLVANRSRLQVSVAMGVGGSFDVLAGVTKRAPQFIQNIGLEWLYRYIKEPARLKRSSLLPRFVGLVLTEKWHKSKGGNELEG